MSGSTACVVLPNDFSLTQREALENYLRAVSSSMEGNAFWIAGQPFSWYITTPEDEETTMIVGDWSPKAVIGVCAMCRGTVSDAYLAMLVAKFAEMFGGVIAFGGHIESFASEVAILTAEGRFHREEQDLLTPEFIYRWLGHPNFRMVN